MEIHARPLLQAPLVLVVGDGGPVVGLLASMHEDSRRFQFRLFRPFFMSQPLDTKGGGGGYEGGWFFSSSFFSTARFALLAGGGGSFFAGH